MSQLLKRPRTSRPFDQADILSRLGETICLPPLEIPSPIRREIHPPTPAPKTPIDEDPERWDGLS